MAGKSASCGCVIRSLSQLYRLVGHQPRRARRRQRGVEQRSGEADRPQGQAERQPAAAGPWRARRNPTGQACGQHESYTDDENGQPGSGDWRRQENRCAHVFSFGISASERNKQLCRQVTLRSLAHLPCFAEGISGLRSVNSTFFPNPLTRSEKPSQISWSDTSGMGVFTPRLPERSLQCGVIVPGLPNVCAFPAWPPPSPLAAD